jgi:hypothetical protein
LLLESRAATRSRASRRAFSCASCKRETGPVCAVGTRGVGPAVVEHVGGAGREGDVGAVHLRALRRVSGRSVDTA